MFVYACENFPEVGMVRPGVPGLPAATLLNWVLASTTKTCQCHSF